MILNAVDMFCGAGGTSTGLYEAADDLGLMVDLLAINHWKIAIATHSANHTAARHICETLDSVNPRAAVPSGHLHLMVASPECTHHSNARGGKPMRDQSRASAWHVLRWAEALRVDNIIVENVREFTNWGPLTTNGRPIKSRRGETFQAFLQALRSLGYQVDYRILNAADYGDPTTRERLFVLARKGRRGIVWPDPTHAKDTTAGLFGKKKPWRAAREIIDWTIPGKSIFKRKKPLSPNTMRRIEAGLRKFSGPGIEPFLVVLRGHNKGNSLDKPVPTLTAGGNHVGLGLCQPFIVPFYGENKSEKQNPRCHSIDEPLPTVPAGGIHAGLCEPFIVGLSHTTDGSDRVHSLNNPLPTQVTKAELALCEPFLVQFNHNSKARSIKEPMPTVMTKDKFGLAEPSMKDMRLDIRFRMLQPHELAAAQSFGKDYKFTGTRADQVRQIGNAVPTQLARALCRAALEEYTR